MLLLYLIWKHTYSAPAEFTFHYASTLSVSTSKHLHQHHIYIPLCFYFIIYFIIKQTLHSLIYIPLCFYFIIGAAFRIFFFIFIYIPLCFYFIPSPFSPFIFFNTSILFVYPTFFIALFSKIFLLPLYKI